MKPIKLTILLVAALFVVNSAFSQETNYKISSWGIKAGGSLLYKSDVAGKYSLFHTEYHGTYEIGSGEYFGFHVGAFANIKLSNIINFQPELLFSSVQGGKYKRNVGTGGTILQDLVFKFSYVQLPLLLEINPIANLGILAGTQFGLNVSREVTIDKLVTKSGSDFDDEIFYGGTSPGFPKGGLKKFDAAIIFGLQYTFIDKITLGMRYNLGLLNGYNYSESLGIRRVYKGWKSNVIQASLGFSF